MMSDELNEKEKRAEAARRWKNVFLLSVLALMVVVAVLLYLFR